MDPRISGPYPISILLRFDSEVPFCTNLLVFEHVLGLSWFCPSQQHRHIAACLHPVPAGFDKENSNGRSYEFKNLNTINDHHLLLLLNIYYHLFVIVEQQ